MKLEVGEKYLTIKIVGHNDIKAFPNKEGRAINKSAPHFKSDGIAVWVNEKKEREQKEKIFSDETITF